MSSYVNSQIVTEFVVGVYVYVYVANYVPEIFFVVSLYKFLSFLWKAIMQSSTVMKVPKWYTSGGQITTRVGYMQCHFQSARLIKHDKKEPSS